MLDAGFTLSLSCVKIVMVIFMQEIQEMLREFNRERDWGKFHTPENLAKSVAIESGELLECFQWNSDYDRTALSEEIADVMLYCLMLCDSTGLDPIEIMRNKIEKNKAKYPVDKARGISKKYTELGE